MKLGFWAVTIITVFVIFFNLGAVPLLDPDEPVYAETPKEMYQFNDFVSPRIYGEYWYDKPPMYYWLVAASYKLFGVSEFSARFPSALLGVCCIWAVYFAVRRLFSQTVAAISSLVLVTSIEFFYLTKAAVTDITLCLCLTVALLSFMEKRYYLFYIFAGLATLTKGPIGFLFPGAIVFLYLLCARNFSELKNMKIPAGIILFALFGLPWYIVMYNLHGAPFIDTFIGFHNITRFTSPEHPEGVLWYYYIPVLLLGFFPWTAVMVQAVWKSLTECYRHNSAMLFLNIWAAFIFVFFSISRTKLVSYILPMYPPLAIIVGCYLADLVQKQKRYSSRAFGWGITLFVLTSLLIAGLFIGLKEMPELKNGVIVVAGIWGLMICGVWLFIWQRKLMAAVWTKIAAMAVFSVILVTMLFPAIALQFSSVAIAREFKTQYDQASPVYVIKFLHPGFAFYADVYGKELKSGEELSQALEGNDRAYFVVRNSEYQGLKDEQRQKLTILARREDKMLLLKK
ncbi:MAG: glycosyltransferase family 39 protein [Pelosinus sp.]|nr:glycosyltransferase family 39 protein [Pelosinus sp.]